MRRPGWALGNHVLVTVVQCWVSGFGKLIVTMVRWRRRRCVERMIRIWGASARTEGVSDVLERRTIVAAVISTMLIAACSSSPSPASSSSSESSTTTLPSTTGVSAATYVDTVCTSMSGWIDALKANNQSFQQDASSTTSSPADVKSAFTTLLVSAVDETQAMRDRIDQEGPPAIDDGDVAHAVLVGALEDVVALFQKALDKSEALDPSNPIEMGRAMDDLGGEIQAGAADVQNALSQMSTPELDAVFSETSSCAPLSS